MSTYTITTKQDNTGLAPLRWRWTACFGDVDAGSDYGFGATEAEAIYDLLSDFVAPVGVRMSTEHRQALIDAAVIAVEYELRILRRDHSLDTESLRSALASPHRYRDALDQIELDYRIEVVTPLALMELLHGHEEP